MTITLFYFINLSFLPFFLSSFCLEYFCLGNSKYPCINKPELKPAEDPVQCKCSPGFFLNVKDVSSPKCEKCELGKYSDGTFINECKSCGTGQAAVPGKYFASYSDKLDYVTGNIDILKNVSCSGQFCHVSPFFLNILRGSYLPKDGVVSIMNSRFNFSHKKNDILVQANKQNYFPGSKSAQIPQM